MVPTNVKTVHQTSLRQRNPDRLRLPSPTCTHGQRCHQQSGQSLGTVEARSVNVKKTTRSPNHAESGTKSLGGEGLELVKPAREPASNRPKPWASLKNAPGILPVRRSLLALVGRKQTVVSFSFRNLRFAPLILAHKGSALP